MRRVADLLRHKLRRVGGRCVQNALGWLLGAELLLHAPALDVELVRTTLNLLLKFEEDIAQVDGELYRLVSAARKS